MLKLRAGQAPVMKVFLLTRRGEDAHGESVRIDALAEPLIGEVEERDQAAGLEEVYQPPPFFPARIDSCRIMAAGMQHDDAAGGETFERVEHGREVEAARLGVIVRIVIDGEPGGFEELAVILPARIADPDLRG